MAVYLLFSPDKSFPTLDYILGLFLVFQPDWSHPGSRTHSVPYFAALQYLKILQNYLNNNEWV